MRRYRNFVIAATILLSAILSHAGTVMLGGSTVADGWLYDWALAGRAALYPQEEDYRSPVVVIGVDHRSLFSDRLFQLPRTMMAPEWANLLNILSEAGVRSIGFYLLFLYPANAFIRNYETPFLQALSRNRDKVVIGRTGTLLPARYFSVAIGARSNPDAVAAFDVDVDTDGVLRRIGRMVRDKDGNAVIGLAAAVLKAAGVETMPEEVRLAPRRHLEALEHYSLIDVLQCGDQDPEAVRQAFDGRVVLIGSALPAEDRKVTSSRYLAEAPFDPEAGEAGPECDLRPRGDTSENDPTAAGVFAHAEAVRAVMDGELVRQLRPWLSGLVAALAAASGAAIGFLLVPAAALFPLLIVAFSLWGGEVLALQANVWYPASPGIAALGLSAVMAYLVRYFLEERRRRQIQRAFGHYLAPTIVERLMEGGEALRLGGETLDVTVMFADLSGFTAYSTRVAPVQLVEQTNRYLSLITDEVDRHGGYVDKYIGDASMAIWGAPVLVEDHALQAVRAALTIRERIDALRAAAEARGEFGFGIKIGVASGPAVVGNVGSEKRFNYTAVGETVNIAARLESLPGIYECAIVIGATAASRVRNEILLRELDRVTVKGRDEPLAIFEALIDLDGVTEHHRTLKTGYEEALQAYRDCRFAEAASLWGRLADTDGPSRVMQERALAYDIEPPPGDWDGVWAITSK